LQLIVTKHDVLLAIKLVLVIMVIVISLRRGARHGYQTHDPVRIEDRAFALAVVLQMLMYTGRPLLGAVRYVLILYPAFLICGAYAERWDMKRLAFYLTALGLLNLTWLWAFLNWSLVL